MVTIRSILRRCRCDENFLWCVQRTTGWIRSKLTNSNSHPINQDDQKTPLEGQRNEPDAESITSERASLFEEQLESIIASAKQNEPQSTSTCSMRSTEEDARSLKEYEDSLKRPEEDIEEENKLREREREIKKQLDEVLMKMKELEKEWEMSSEGGSEIQRRDVEEEFQKKLAEQKEIFDAKIRELREKREEIEREAAAEIEKMREESMKRMLMFVECIRLTLRFEEKETEWKEMLDGLRRPVVKVCTSYYDLQRELHGNTLDEIDKESITASGNIFAKKVATAQELLHRAFGHLDELYEQNKDRVFIKIIMKSLSDMGYQCNFIGEQLVEVMKNPERINSTRQLDHQVSKLSPHSIPTTRQLKEESKSALPEMFQNISEPPYPDWFANFQ